MSADTIHRTVSADGTEIAGRVVGQGPPLVLLHGAMYSGETAFDELLPHLTDRFTCFLPSTRGRGLSADADDYRPERLLEDVTAYVDSIGQPVPMFGWSGGGMMALGAAASSDSVSSVIAHEPAVLEEWDEEFMGGFMDTVERMAVEVEQGRPEEAARVFMGVVLNDDELEAAIANGRHEVAAPSVPADVRLFENLDPNGPSMTDPDLLATVTVPVLLLQGERTPPVFERGNRHVVEHAPNAENRIIPGAGHGAPGIAPEAVARELISFLEGTPEPA
ncbi:MAG: alpha/beta hydrolase [Ilumatobacter sp.]|nr:MAG: alpha/beta hydrolase [Ilumatobacter sp.]